MKKFKRILQNLPGLRTRRKLLVIESDDWGSIRMPSQSVLNLIARKEDAPCRDPYLKYDSLASEADLQALFDVLSSVKDVHGKPAVLTANCVVANPDFEKIQQNGMQQYVYEPFTTTLKRYPKHAGAFDLWKEGMRSGLFRPQYHGREHLNVYQWMKGLQNKDPRLQKAFDYRMINFDETAGKMRFGYMEGLDYFSEEERQTKTDILKDGMRLFKDIFGYASKSFIANCYIWDETVETALKELGVDYLQGISNQLVPVLDMRGGHRYRLKKHYTGQKNKQGQVYLVRNAFFEPSLEPDNNWVKETLDRIAIAYKCGKPAIIGSHRLNYIGFIEEKNRNQNLTLLKKLLLEITKRWPMVEFKSTDQLSELFT